MKPVMSRAGSGEVYLVAKHFIGLSSALGSELMRCALVCSHQFLIQEKKSAVRLPSLGLSSFETSSNALFPLNWIPDTFYKEFCNAAQLFANRQGLAIKANLRCVFCFERYRRSLC